MGDVIDIIEKTASIKLSRHFSVLVVGSGVGGLAATYRLKQAGIKDLVVLEKAATLGGTWRENTYPGIACDVDSRLYSFTFYPNARWSQLLAPGAEIRAYLEEVADRLDLRSHIRFKKEVVACVFQDETCTWRVETADGDVLTADVVIAASGFLHQPLIPEFAGRDRFKGLSFHSTEWPQDLDVTGKRVGIIGAGSTATQLTCAIVDKVARLSFFKRDSHWVYPLQNAVHTEADRQQFARPKALRDIYDELTTNLFGAYGDIGAGAGENYDAMRIACENYLATVRDPELRRKLTPNSTFGCKRVVMSTEFYTAVQKETFELVSTPIETFEPRGILTADGVLHDLDVVVLATGFKSHHYCRSLNVKGLGGISLHDLWAERPSSFASVSLAGFPNFFMVGGPFSAIGNTSFMTCAEMQMTYILRVLKVLEEQKAKAIVPTAEAEHRFWSENQAGAARTTWLSGCRSFFVDSRGHITNWSRRPEEYIAMITKGPQLQDFQFIGATQRDATHAGMSRVD